MPRAIPQESRTPSHPDFWRDHLLYTLGVLSDYQPGVVIPRADIQDKVLFMERINPEAPPEPMVKINHGIRIGLYRLKPSKWYRRGFIDAVGKDSWMLTQAGVAPALLTRVRFHPNRLLPQNVTASPNLTALWISTRPSLMDTLRLHLMAVLPSWAHGDVRDHVADYLAAVIRRDSFRTRLERGEIPTDSQVSGWAYRYACSEFRDNAQDAHLRASRGAMTAREREARAILDPGSERARKASQEAKAAAHKVVVKTTMPSEIIPIYSEAQSDRVGVLSERGGTSLVDVARAVSLTPEDILLHEEAGNVGLDRIEQAIRKHKAGAPDRYVRLFHMIRDGLSVEDIGEQMGVKRNRAATMKQELRDALTDAMKAGELDDARGLLQQS